MRLSASFSDSESRCGFVADVCDIDPIARRCVTVAETGTVVAYAFGRDEVHLLMKLLTKWHGAGKWDDSNDYEAKRDGYGCAQVVALSEERRDAEGR